MKSMVLFLCVGSLAGCASPDGTARYLGVGKSHPTYGTIWNDLSPVRVARAAFCPHRAIHND